MHIKLYTVGINVCWIVLSNIILFTRTKFLCCFSIKQNNKINENMKKIYIMPYFRATSYFVGFAAALVTSALVEKGYKFSSVRITSLFRQIKVSSWFESQTSAVSAAVAALPMVSLQYNY